MSKKKTALQRDLQERLPIEDNPLEFAHVRTLAVDNVQCEKYLVHEFDGTLATKIVRVKFLTTLRPSGYVLCDSCAEALMGHLAPCGNTGLNSTDGHAK